VKYFSAKAPRTIVQQYAALVGTRTAAGTGRRSRHSLTWEFDVSPSPLSRTYRAKLVYQEGETPKVFVLAPDLHALAGDRPLPHVYEQNPPRLCLYLPGTHEWTADSLLARTVVPWTSLWFRYFEDWLSSGEWRGGGVHPKPFETG
jgi:hypothetical protein